MTIAIAKNRKPGYLPVLAIDAGGRRLALVDSDNVRLRVVAPSRLPILGFPRYAVTRSDVGTADARPAGAR